MNYPSPCKTCKAERCREMACPEWQIRYRYRQKQINAYALKLARVEVTEKTDAWVYPHADEYRRYLATHPCENCLARDVCDTPCQRYLLWYDAHRERARRRIESCL